MKSESKPKGEWMLTFEIRSKGDTERIRGSDDTSVKVIQRTPNSLEMRSGRFCEEGKNRIGTDEG